MSDLTVGILALQGAFSEHANMLSRLGVSVRLVRQPSDLVLLDGLILPGGESTTMALLAEGAGLLTPLQSLILDAQIPVWGTCAGLILLSSSAVNTKAGGQRLLGGLDISIQRNAFGRQAQSFVLPLEMPILGPEPLQGVFIRAPAISPLEPGKDSQVRILAKLPVTHGSHIVAVQQGHILGTAFHPELTSDSRMHEYFMQMVSDKRAGTKSN